GEYKAEVVPGRAEDDFGGVAVNSDDADGINGRLGSPRISPFLTARSALFPLRPCGRVVGIGTHAIGNSVPFPRPLSVCHGSTAMYVNGFLVGPGYAAFLGGPVFGWLKPAFATASNASLILRSSAVGLLLRDDDNIRHARTSADSRTCD